MEFYDSSILWHIGETLGMTVKIDANTLKPKYGYWGQTTTERGKFSRMCIEVDLRYGHRKEECPLRVVNEILGTLPPKNELGPNCLTWGLSNHGLFTTKSPNQPTFWLLEIFTALTIKFGELCGGGKGPWRIKCFMWMLLKDGLKTNKFRCTRNMSDTDKCPLCNAFPESTFHALRDCVRANKIWCLIKADNFDRNFFSSYLFTWVYVNITSTDTHHSGAPWNTIFVVTLSNLWHSRNDFVFNHVTKPEATVVHNVIITAAEIDHALTHFQEPAVSNPIICQKLITWTFPTGDFIKCNVDGSVKYNGSVAACEGVFRDSLGAWRFGFTRHLGSATITATELRGILTALQLARGRMIQKLWLETDSATTVTPVQNGCQPTHPSWSIVQAIRLLIQEPWHVHISHTYKEGNGVAD
ncbi:Ribonuclease H domain [Sesbania bispinosa]|nr:Ribonuclease H domain [Sesbania bispinosa]